MAVVYKEFNGDMAGEPPVLQGPKDAVVINSGEYLPEELPEPTTIVNNYITPEPSFIDKYGLYMLIGFVVLVMVLMWVFRKKIA